MEKLQIYELITHTKTVDELKEAIKTAFGENGEIQGSRDLWTVPQMLELIDMFIRQVEDWLRPTFLPTREYGIRQQLVYILFLEEKL